MFSRIFSIVWVITFTALTVINVQEHNYWGAGLTAFLVLLESIVIATDAVSINFKITKSVTIEEE